MRAESAARLGIWELTVLCTLREGAMHPYEIQRLLRERHKDELLVLKRGSLYHAINRLLLAGLIETVSTGRRGRSARRIESQTKASATSWSGCARWSPSLDAKPAIS